MVLVIVQTLCTWQAWSACEDVFFYHVWLGAVTICPMHTTHKHTHLHAHVVGRREFAKVCHHALLWYWKQEGGVRQTYHQRGHNRSWIPSGMLNNYVIWRVQSLFSAGFTDWRAQLHNDQVSHLDCNNCQYLTLVTCVPLSIKEIVKLRPDSILVQVGQVVAKYL